MATYFQQHYISVQLYLFLYLLPFHQHPYQHHYKAQPTYDKDGTSRPKSAKSQFNYNEAREMWMGTKLPHLQKHRGGLGWESIRSKSNSLMYSGNTLPKVKTQGRSRTPNQTRTINYHKASTPKYPSMCLINTQNRYTWEKNRRREQND